MGIVKAVCISEKEGTQKVNTHSARFIENFGIEHDAHAGNWHRQASLIPRERIDISKERGAQVEDGVFGENLIVEGHDFKTPPVGTVFRCSDVVLRMTQIGKGCHAHCAIYRQAGDCIMSREGALATMEHGRVILEGDELVIVEQPE